MVARATPSPTIPDLNKFASCFVFSFSHSKIKIHSIKIKTFELFPKNKFITCLFELSNVEITDNRTFESFPAKNENKNNFWIVPSFEKEKIVERRRRRSERKFAVLLSWLYTTRKLSKSRYSCSVSYESNTSGTKLHIFVLF